MNFSISFVTSAFRHGIAEADIRHALQAHLLDSLMEGFQNKYVLIGFDTKANLLEIMYNLADDGSVRVFHAMKCRREFLEMLNL